MVRIRNLMYLYVDGTYLPVGYKNLTSLEQLGMPHFTEDDDPEELRYLTELRGLEFHLPSMYPPEKLLILLESLGKLHKLHHLYMATDDENIDNLGDWVPSSLQLQFLQLGGWYETMPARIISSSFPLLSLLCIKVHQVRLEDIQVLGTLPALRDLRLQSDEDTSTEEQCATERSFMLSKDAFPSATRCLFENVLFAPCMFPRGAMPMVQVLCFGLLVSDILSGGDLFIRNLPSLQSVRIKLYGDERGSQKYSEARAAVERAVADHPNCLNAKICWRPTR
jgi:disease resistance protein RPM1